ncbi:MAG: hypothetical protein ABI443_09660 [Chthoniobacterales bacterium]
MTRLFVILAGILFCTSALFAEEKAAEGKMDLEQLVQFTNHIKSSCFTEWGAWRNVDKAKLIAFQKSVAESPALATERDLNHNLVAFANGLVAMQLEFEKAVANYEKTTKQEFGDIPHWKKSLEEYRALQLDIARRAWTLKQESSSTVLQIQINALQRFSSTVQNIAIPLSDPMFTTAAEIEKDNAAAKEQADLLARSKVIHLEIVNILPEGVIGHLRDEYAIPEHQNSRGETIPTTHRYTMDSIFVTNVPNPVKGSRIICKAAPDGSYSQGPLRMQKWKSIETRDEQENQ